MTSIYEPRFTRTEPQLPPNVSYWLNERITTKGNTHSFTIAYLLKKSQLYENGTGLNKTSSLNLCVCFTNHVTSSIENFRLTLRPQSRGPKERRQSPKIGNASEARRNKQRSLQFRLQNEPSYSLTFPDSSDHVATQRPLVDATPAKALCAHLNSRVTFVRWCAHRFSRACYSSSSWKSYFKFLYGRGIPSGLERFPYDID